MKTKSATRATGRTSRRSMNRRWIWSIVSLLGISVVAAPSAALAQTTLLFNNPAPPSANVSVDVILPWLKDVEKVTEGRVKIKVPPQSVAPPPEQMSMVQNGVADGAFILNSFLQKSHPLLQIAFLPGTMDTAMANGVAYWRTYQKFFAPKHPINEVQLLGFFTNPPGNLYNLDKKPIQSLAELKGKKVWSLPGVTARAIGLTGASVVPGPAVRMYEVISKGVVDAFCCTPYSEMKSFRVTQYAHATTEVNGGVFAATFSVFINKAKWNSISPKDRAAIMKISGEALARRGAVSDAHNQVDKKSYLAHGGIVVKAKPAFNAALKKVWKPLYDKWIAMANQRGVDGKAALAYYLAQQKQVAAGH